MLIDTHCHLDFPEFDNDRKEVIGRAKDAGIGYIVNIGSSLEGSRRSLGLTREFSCVYATVGIHPHEADKINQQALDEIRVLAGSDKVVAIGEIGLDYYKGYSKPENQKPLFLSLLRLAKEFSLPLVIHTRSAQDETLGMLKEFMPLRAVVHCFSGDNAFFKDCLAAGFMISFTCNITYKKAENLRALVREIPLERLMLETDAPFLAPQGLRGRRNEPAFVKNLSEEIARIRQIDQEEIAIITTKNAKEFFSLK
ncbi:MAG: TatD family hydrolase [bacterium]